MRQEVKTLHRSADPLSELNPSNPLHLSHPRTTFSFSFVDALPIERELKISSKRDGFWLQMEKPICCLQQIFIYLPTGWLVFPVFERKGCNWLCIGEVIPHVTGEWRLGLISNKWDRK